MRSGFKTPVKKRWQQEVEESKIMLRKLKINMMEMK